MERNERKAGHSGCCNLCVPCLFGNPLKLQEGTKNKDFLEAISKTDFLFLTETWSNTNLDIPGFEAINSDIAKYLSNAACR